MQTTLNCGGTLIDISSPVVMGIINTTPDSFFEQSRSINTDATLRTTEAMLIGGATFIDIGGQSTRPNAAQVPVNEEINRVIPHIAAIKKAFPQAIISIDTYNADVAAAAAHAGATLINDISGGSDPKMHATVAQLCLPYVLMHIQGTPQTMQNAPEYTDVVAEVIQHLQLKIHTLKQQGIYDVIIDVGFGFGKTLTHNYQLLNGLHLFKNLFDNPILVGVSRKSMIYKPLHTTPDCALHGTTVLHTIALQQGAKILRTHDVVPAVQAIKLMECIDENMI
jgi:dihydropteroate synthase